MLAVLLGALFFGHGALQSWVASVVDACRRAGPWVYFGAMAVLPMFGFSLFAFVASAGPVFGPVLGISHVIAYGLLALIVNVTLSYLLAAGALRPWVERAVAWFGCRLPDARKAGTWEVAMLVRLLPGPPFGLQSAALGVARIPFGLYLATSVLVPAAYFSGIVVLETGALSRNRWLIVPAALFLGFVSFACRRIKLRLSRRATAPAAG